MKRNNMLDLPRVTRFANRLYAVASALLVLLPLVVAVFLWREWSDPSWLTDSFAMLPSDTALTPWKSTLVITLGAVALLPIGVALVQMRRLFARYRRGEILIQPCARHILHIGWALAALALAQLVVLPLQIVVLTMDNPPDDRLLSTAFGSESLWLLLSGGLLIVIGWVMVEAVRAADENAGFI